MGFASKVLILLLGAFLAKGQTTSEGLSKIKLCLLDFSRGHLMINCSPKIKQDESSYFIGNLAKRTESTSGKPFNPWIGKRKKRSIDREEKAFGQGKHSDVGYPDTVKCEDLDNFLADFCKKLRDLEQLDWLTTSEAQDYPIGQTDVKEVGLARQDDATDSDWSIIRRAIKRNNLLRESLKNSSPMERLQKQFDWDRLKRAETLKKNDADWNQKK